MLNYIGIMRSSPDYHSKSTEIIASFTLVLLTAPVCFPAEPRKSKCYRLPTFDAVHVLFPSANEFPACGSRTQTLHHHFRLFPPIKTAHSSAPAARHNSSSCPWTTVFWVLHSPLYWFHILACRTTMLNRFPVDISPVNAPYNRATSWLQFSKRFDDFHELFRVRAADHWYPIMPG